jgi:hypothetical protein
LAQSSCAIEVALLVTIFILLPRQLDRAKLAISALCLVLAIGVPFLAARLFPAPVQYEIATYNAFDSNCAKRPRFEYMIHVLAA